MKYSFTAVEHGQKLHRYTTNACRSCAIKDQCTTGKERRITRWEHEHVLEAAQRRLDQNPQAMRVRRETVEHPFGTMKARMGATHFLTKTLPKVATEMALSVLAYNLTRVMNIDLGQILQHVHDGEIEISEGDSPPPRALSKITKSPNKD